MSGVTAADIEAMHAGRKAGFSQSEIAELFGLSPSYVSRLIRGRRRESVSSYQGIEVVRGQVQARKRRALAACELRARGKTCKEIASEIGVSPPTVSMYLFEEDARLLYLSSHDLQVLRDDESGEETFVVLERHREKRRLRAFLRWQKWHREYWRAYGQRPEVKARARAYRERPEVKQRLREYRNRPEVKQRASHRRKEFIRGARHRRNSQTVSLDTELFDGDISRYDRTISRGGGPDPFEQLTGHEAGLADVLGDLTEDDIDGLSESELLKIRDQLIAKGFAPAVMTNKEEEHGEVKIPA